MLEPTAVYLQDLHCVDMERESFTAGLSHYFEQAERSSKLALGADAIDSLSESSDDWDVLGDLDVLRENKKSMKARLDRFDRLHRWEDLGPSDCSALDSHRRTIRAQGALTTLGGGLLKALVNMQMVGEFYMLYF